MLKKIGVLTSGGDAPGMNACIRAVVRSAAQRGVDVIGIRRGYSGLLKGDFIRLNRRAAANIIQRGGTILESSRCEEFKTAEFRKKAVEILEGEGVEGIIAIGGEGTFHGAAALAEESNIKVIGVPATIDNDVYGTDFTIGFDTAINTALEAIDRIRDTADAFERVFFVEVMGRLSGFIALEVGIAGGAEEIIIPEKVCDLEKLCSILKDSFRKGKRSSIVVVTESNEQDHTMQMAHYVQHRLKISSRVCILGHLQRGGSPTARDRILATKLGIAAVDGILNGRHGHFTGESKGEVVYIPLHDVWEKKKHLDEYSLESYRALAG
jgi:6-phosphofructokinase 1